MTMLKPPPLTRSGNYDPMHLFTFLCACKKRGVPDHQIAEALSVPLHRIKYALGPGLEFYRKRAMAAGDQA